MVAAPDTLAVLGARWRAPPRVRAVTTLRRGGVSEGRFASLNLAAHVDDHIEHVRENRRRLRRALALPGEPCWLQQVHGTRCVDLAEAAGNEVADGSYTTRPALVCAVLSADCLPLFVSGSAGDCVGLFHVGWRGLAGGMVERALEVFAGTRDVHCWLGPAIGPAAFEVGPEVREALALGGNDGCFAPAARPGHWLADLYALTAHRLRRGGVADIDWDPAACTFSDAARFFSHRRGAPCGRMASLIWIQPRENQDLVRFAANRKKDPVGTG